MYAIITISMATMTLFNGDKLQEIATGANVANGDYHVIGDNDDLYWQLLW